MASSFFERISNVIAAVIFDTFEFVIAFVMVSNDVIIM